MSGVWKEVKAEWLGGSAFMGFNQKGGSVQIGTVDEKPGVGPMEMLLLGLAGCTGMDIISILEKKRLKIEDFKIFVRGNRADDYPKIYTEIEVSYLLWGRNIPKKDVEQAIQLSKEKYCSVGLMLGKAASIRSTYRILAPGEELEPLGNPVSK
jgi:putative redox protein